ncbi:MAG: FAD-dependent oxidoreductase [Myxococcota bacterium]|nr:FAD-dependent oxidoreductase [Myxococcota bacterium]
MESTRYLIVGAGVTGLAMANFLRSDQYLVLERDEAIGGYCKTIKQDGFVWDYSGHFFHFRQPEIERMLVERMPPGEVSTVRRCSQVYHRGKRIDFPFQKNIHQLEKEEFIDCLYDLWRATAASGENPSSFKEMLLQRFGRSIAEKFLIPYNEKLYACDVQTLDVDAMGRFFPYAKLADIIKNMREPDNASYNASFTYPRGGAIEYVKALEQGVRPGAIRLGEALQGVDLERKLATTNKGTISFEYLISSAPFDRFLTMTALEQNEAAVAARRRRYQYNKVMVFNLGFDRKGWSEPHWVYFADPALSYYRVGFYDNIFASDRMSLYVEIGAGRDADLETEQMRQRVLADLRRVGIIDEHQLVSWHSVVMDPAYVHVTREAKEELEQLRRVLALRGVFSIGRYGGWTYCSIEDNIIEARALAELFNQLEG